jgi:hypothetical protein
MARERNTLLVLAFLGVMGLWGGCSRPSPTASITAETDVASNVAIVTWNVRG